MDACPADDTQHCPYNRDKYRDATIQLSGPILKDKLWFFGSYQYQRDYDSQPGTDPAFPAGSDADRIFFKLNWQISAKNKIHVRAPRRLLRHPLPRHRAPPRPPPCSWSTATTRRPA